jgi:hypothetical protein
MDIDHYADFSAREFISFIRVYVLSIFVIECPYQCSDLSDGAFIDLLYHISVGISGFSARSAGLDGVYIRLLSYTIH